MGKTVGDWYFALDGRPPLAGRSDEPWQECFRDGDQALFIQAPSEFWVGAQWIEHSDARGRSWCFGSRAAGTDAVSQVAWEGLDPASLGGQFVLLQRRSDGELTVTTDRLGTVHAYRGPRGFGSCMATVAAGSGTTFDQFGLTGFFGLGFFADDRTFYDDVRIFCPARRYRLRAGSAGAHAWHSERYWLWRHTPDPDRSYAETVEEFSDLFVRLMTEAESVSGGLAIPISGGLDSRLTLAALPQRGRDRWAFSYGYGPRSVETKIGRRLAERRDLAFDTFQILPYLSEQEASIMAAVEGFQDVTQTRQASIASELRQHADTVVAAHWGDVWLDDMGLAGRSGAIGPEELAQHTLGRLRKRGREWLWQHLCQHSSGEAPEARLSEWAGEALTAYDHIEDPDFRVKAFKTDQWSFRWTVASLRAYQIGAFPCLPFYDPSLIDFFAGVPTEYVAGRRLEIDAIKRLAPDLARVPWQAFDASLYTWQYFNSLLLPKRALKKALRWVRREQVIERNWEVQFLHREGRAYLEERLLRKGLRLHEWVTPTAVRELFDSFWSKRGPADGYSVSMLLTFSLWLERQ